MSDCCNDCETNDVAESSEEVCSSSYIYEEDQAENETADKSQEYPNSIERAVSNDKPSLVITYFKDGPLGINLHRRPTDGIIVVSDIIPDTQATGLDVQVGDELWGIGTIEMGESFIEKEAWQGIVEYIKQSVRPLEATWRRRSNPQLNFSPRESTQSPSLDARQLSRDECERRVSSDIVPSTLALEINNEQFEAEEEEEDIQVGQVSPTYKILETVVSALVKKPANGKDAYKNDFHYRYLLDGDRRLLRRSDLTTPGPQTLWMKTFNKKHVILLTDMLIITTPQVVQRIQCYVVDHIIDLQTCKLRSEGHVFGGSLDSKAGGANSGNGGMQSPTVHREKTPSERQQIDCAFEVIWPGGSMQLFADSKETKEVWVLNLFLAVCSRVGGDNNGQGQVLGWRHQYMLGTMHSAVLSHDEARVRELIAMCDAGEMEFAACIDAIDEDGYTPLHYACIKRMHGITRVLHEAAADVTAQDHRGLTPLHWAAMQLDDFTLSLLCSHVFDLDLCDKLNRTPLYMACVEGRDVMGHTDLEALKKCVSCMLTHQPNVNLYDQQGYTLVHYLAASWQYEALDLLLHADADANARSSANGMTPLHLACMAAPIKLAEGEAKRIIQGADTTTATDGPSQSESTYEKLNHPFGSTTLRTLLKSGARPNARDSKGRSPLHILAEPGRDDLWDLMELTDGVAVLMSFGARFDDSALLTNLKNRLIGVSIEALVERWASLPVINGDALHITLGHFKRGGGPMSDSVSGKMNSSESLNSSSRKGPSSPTLSTASRSNQLAPQAGGYPAPVFNEPTDKCSMCWFQFSLFRRPHHCRLCDALCCDECSKKRCLVEYQQVRTCDSCYNRAMDLQEKKNREDMLGRMKPIPKSNSNASKLYLENRAKLMAESAAAEKDNEAERSPAGRRAAGGTAQTMNVLSETHEKLLERGEKLSRLADNSNQMASQANEFAKMAKALNEQQRNRWF